MEKILKYKQIKSANIKRIIQSSAVGYNLGRQKELTLKKSINRIHRIERSKTKNRGHLERCSRSIL